MERLTCPLPRRLTAGQVPASRGFPLAFGLVRIERVVIAGAGLAGLRTAEELRSQGFEGSMTMVGAERRPPYDRPPLTKKFMTGQLDDTTLAADLAALGLDLRLGETATVLDGTVLRTDHGEYPFDAPGGGDWGRRRCGLPGSGQQRFLRTLDDALELRSALRPGTRLAVVGAGWIGAELATSRRTPGLPGHRDRGGARPARGGDRGRGGCVDGALVRRGRGGPAAGPAG